MARANVNKDIQAPAAEVWSQLADFAGIKPGGPIEAVSYEGEGVGMVRTLTMGGGQVAERLEEHDADQLTFTYAITNDDSPLPFKNYSATVKLTDNGDGSTNVDWTGTFEAEGDEGAAINVATGIYAGAIKGAKIALQG
ncbi:MAG: SRPBCC family protein [Pseudomonadota bacterium]